MPRANRYILPGYVYHPTHRCYKRFLALSFPLSCCFGFVGMRIYSISFRLSGILSRMHELRAPAWQPAPTFAAISFSLQA